jgi:hypothetical protein
MIPGKAVSVKPIPAFLAAWSFAGLGAVVGSILGHGAGKPGLFAGAVLGGVCGIWVAVGVVAKLRWLSPRDRRGAFVGGILGFAVAAPVAVNNLHTPVIPVLICALAGVGLLVGAAFGRWAARS